RNRLATSGHIPAGEIEKMDRLFENPASDAVAIVAPAAGTLAIGKTRQLDEGGPRPADGAVFDELLDAAPERRDAQLVANGEHQIVTSGECDQLVALGD